MEFVDDWVPHRVKVVGFIVIRNREGIATSVSSRVGRVNSAEAVERLMNVPHVVDEKSESVRLPVFLILHVLHHGGVDEAVFVAVFFVDPS